MVATGILLSRIVGLVRNRVFAHYFGTSDAADAFNAAFRIPNFLQNLFGEGVLSASFIPVYARLRAEGREADARAAASAVAALLGLTVSVLVLAGVLLAPWLIDVIAPGFEGEKREATARLVRILFPGAGLLVLSAWCLGVLNSHRRFFLSYVAPVVWNLAIIAALMAKGGQTEGFDLAEVAAWGSVVGSLLQFGIQLPTVLGLARRAAVGTAVRWSRAAGGQELRAGVRGTRRRADQRVCGHAAREPASDRCGRGGVLRAGAVHAAGESLRHVGVGGGAAGDVERGRDGDRARRVSPQQARGGAAADRVPRHSVGGGVHRAGRRGDRCALPVGRVHPRDDGVRVGHPGGGFGGTAAVYARAALLLGVLCAARHPHAAPDRAGAGEPRRSPSATPSRSTCRRRPAWTSGGERPGSRSPQE